MKDGGRGLIEGVKLKKLCYFNLSDPGPVAPVPISEWMGSRDQAKLQRNRPRPTQGCEPYKCVLEKSELVVVPTTSSKVGIHVTAPPELAPLSGKKKRVFPELLSFSSCR
ncbi:hypothetical protein GBF38_022984, partial [Nibea albiflora]